MGRVVEMIDKDALASDDEAFLKQRIGEAIDCIKKYPNALKATEKLMQSAGPGDRGESS